MKHVYNYSRAETWPTDLRSASNSHYSALIFAPLRKERAGGLISYSESIFRLSNHIQLGA